MSPLATIRLILLLVASPAGSAAGQSAAVPVGSTSPALVVLVTIDQFRADYLERFGPQLQGGLARLVRDGAWFTDAHHDHAITETAPGHATLLAGRHPRSTGIMMNSIGVGDELSPLIAGGVGPGASPKRFTGSTLVDWLKNQDARSRVLSVSVKDRGAILPVGRSRGEVYWYSPDGRFTTSKYYRDTLPPWVDAFNARRLPHRYAGARWTPLLPDSAYREQDRVAAESDGVRTAFPHLLPDEPEDAASLLRVTPFMDDVTVAFALHGVQALGLGTGPQTDLLAVSLSSTDYVGHQFGPDSREMHDQVLRADRALGVLLDSLHRLRDSSRVVVVLTADHGVGAIPEVAAAGGSANAVRVDLAPVLVDLRARLRAAGVDSFAIDIDQQLVAIDHAAFRKAGRSAEPLIDWVETRMRALPGVRRVDRYGALLADSLRDPIARRWAHQLPANVPVALVITLDSLSSWGGNIASHGSTYDHDSRVPLIFYGAGIAPGRIPGFVRTVDLAPTLAAITGVTPTERLDGVVLWKALRQPPARRAP